MTTSIHVEGLEEAMRKFNKMDVEKALDRAAPPILEDIRNVAGRYPPSLNNVREVGGELRWYQRGRGQMPYGPYNSEDLKSRWYTRIADIAAEIGNEASYAQWVHGEEQNWRHRIGGWRRLPEVAREKVPELERRLAQELENQFRRG